MQPERKKSDASDVEAGKWVPLGRASAELGQSRLATLSSVIGGDLQAMKEPLSGWIYISRESLDRVLASRV